MLGEGLEHPRIPAPLLEHLRRRLDEIPLGRDARDGLPLLVSAEHRVEQVSELVEEGTDVAEFHEAGIARRCEALDKAIQEGASSGRLMHLCYAILGLVAAHFVSTEEVLLPYLDKAFDQTRFEKEVLSPLRVRRTEA